MINKSLCSILIFFLIQQSSVDESDSVLKLCFSTKCFECESRYDPRCLDPFSLDPFGLVDCEKIAYEPLPVSTMCWKIVIEGLEKYKKKMKTKK